MRKTPNVSLWPPHTCNTGTQTCNTHYRKLTVVTLTYNPYT